MCDSGPPLSSTPLRACVLTPPGRGAIAVARVAGPGALRTVARLCGSAKLRQLESTPQVANQLLVARWQGPEGEQIVLHVIDRDTVDINCHGGDMAVQSILADLDATGVRQISWQEMIRQQEPDPIRSEAS